MVQLYNNIGYIFQDIKKYFRLANDKHERRITKGKGLNETEEATTV